MLGSITTGAENDLQQVTMIARNMVARWGMSSRLGLVSFSERSSPFGGGIGGDMGQRDFSEATASVIDDETRDLVQSAYQQVRQMLVEHRATLDRIGQELRRHETLDAKQLSQILMETGVNLAEVAPIPNAETTAGIKDVGSDLPKAVAPANGMGTISTASEGLTSSQN